jgi:DNA-binding GntR family transcriptional regulator
MSMTLVSEAPTDQRAAALAYESLRALILKAALPPGSVVQDRRLADELGVSRTPVREALQRLEGEGFVERRGRVLLVASVGLAEVCEIFNVRQILEAEAARCACPRIDGAMLIDIRARIEKMVDPAGVSDDEHRGADDLVHLSIARESGNALLLKLIDELRQKTRLFGLNRIPSRFEAGRTEHLAILDALGERDALRAAELMSAHIANARQAVVRSLTGRD